ncbi:MAG: hypothetical protein Q7T57_00455 [Dehalococcoidales bacterium]|nr:hypothetical protein [Dehalococcoidales bacterium]
MAKQAKQPIKCAQCDLEFPQSELSEEHKHKAFVWKGKVMCEECLFKMGINQDDVMTYGAFLNSQQPRKPQKL